MQHLIMLIASPNVKCIAYQGLRFDAFVDFPTVSLPSSVGVFSKLNVTSVSPVVTEVEGDGRVFGNPAGLRRYTAPGLRLKHSPSSWLLYTDTRSCGLDLCSMSIY